MKKRILIICLVLLSSAVVFDTAQADLILNPTDDVWVRLSEPDTNKDDFQMQAAYSNFPNCVNVALVYLRYDLSSVYKDLGTDTTVRLYVSIGAAIGGEVSIWSTGDDWNGSSSGLGSEETLTWNNAPALDTKLDTQSTPGEDNWVEFTGSNLSTYINSQRSDNGGDDVASFVVGWDACIAGEFADSINFEDRENSGGTGNPPELYPLGPTAVQVKRFQAHHASAGITQWVILSMVLSGAVAVFLSRKFGAGK